MPTYQYACTACGHAFEAVQAFSDPSLTECPQCAGRLRKVFNSVGIVFKGSGFYRTDSRKKQDGDTGRREKVNGEVKKSEGGKPAAVSSSTDGKAGSSSGGSSAKDSSSTAGSAA